MEPVANFFAAIAADISEELIQSLLTQPSLRIERIVSRGHSSPDNFWYDQDQDEWVLVLKGSARLRFENDHGCTLGPGDYLKIAAHCRHRVEWTTPDEPTIWLAIHYDPSPATVPVNAAQ
jgi:cupin 2 domain-containing protein